MNRSNQQPTNFLWDNKCQCTSTYVRTVILKRQFLLIFMMTHPNQFVKNVVTQWNDKWVRRRFDSMVKDSIRPITKQGIQMKNEQYMSWFRGVVEMGWICGLYHPQEILANYLRAFYQFTPYTEPLPYDQIERFLIDTTTHDFMLVGGPSRFSCKLQRHVTARGDSERPSLQESVEHFNRFYEDRRMDFGIYTRLGVTDATPQE